VARKSRYLQLPEENWGQRVHRAYRQQRDATGRKYIDVAALISKVIEPKDHPTVERDEEEVRLLPQGRGDLVLSFESADAKRWLTESLGLL
jgi:hypothetical protein